MHYQRRRRRASPNWVGPKTPMQRLEENSERVGDCLLWTGRIDVNGTAHLTLEPYGRTYLIHRAAWLLRHGEPPAETPLILHRCENLLCWADEHLYAGTHADMWADTIARGHRNCRKCHYDRTPVTECHRGHAFDEANTYVDPAGTRNCRKCQRIAVDAYRERKRQQKRVSSGHGRAA